MNELGVLSKLPHLMSKSTPFPHSASGTPIWTVFPKLGIYPSQADKWHAWGRSYFTTRAPETLRCPSQVVEFTPQSHDVFEAEEEKSQAQIFNLPSHQN
jgi:hypothetical protein